jgi:hypothetical protein
VLSLDVNAILAYPASNQGRITLVIPRSHGSFTDCFLQVRCALTHLKFLRAFPNCGENRKLCIGSRDAPTNHASRSEFVPPTTTGPGLGIIHKTFAFLAFSPCSSPHLFSFSWGNFLGITNISPSPCFCTSAVPFLRHGDLTIGRSELRR